MIVFGWTLRGLTNVARSVGILAMSPLHCFIIVLVDLGVSMMIH